MNGIDTQIKVSGALAALGTTAALSSTLGEQFPNFAPMFFLYISVILIGAYAGSWIRPRTYRWEGIAKGASAIFWGIACTWAMNALLCHGAKSLEFTLGLLGAVFASSFSWAVSQRNIPSPAALRIEAQYAKSVTE